MRNILLSSLALVGAVAMTAVSPMVFAAPVAAPWTVGVDSIATGTAPAGIGPWLSAAFQQTGSNTGTLTLTSSLSGGEFLQGNGDKNLGWAFNFGDALTSLKCTSGTCASSATFGGSYSGGPQGGANATGNFNVLFTWDKNRFGAGDTAVYEITFASTLTGSPFAANANGNSSLAHIQGIGKNGSVWATSGAPDGGVVPNPDPVPVPEPAEIGIFGLGLVLLGGLLGIERRRRRIGC